MKRTALRPGKPLVRRTPLRRGAPLRSGSSLNPGGPLPAESDKRKRERPERDAVRQQVTERDRTCQATAISSVACGGRLDVHEIWSRGRFPGSHLHAEAAVLVCRQHHRYLTDHPAVAEALGLLVPSTTERPW